MKLNNAKNIVLILLLTTCFSCKEKPNYNPFDNQFNVSTNHLKKDNCDVMVAGCGYFNFQLPQGRLRPFYQVYDEEFNKVIAKGFTYYLDTFKIDDCSHDNHIYKKAIDSFKISPVNIEVLNYEFDKYDYQFLSKDLSSITIFNSKTNDTINLFLTQSINNQDCMVIIELEYFNSPRNFQN